MFSCYNIFGSRGGDNLSWPTPVPVAPNILLTLPKEQDAFKSVMSSFMFGFCFSQ